MGAICSCFCFEDLEAYSDSDASVHRNCISLRSLSEQLLHLVNFETFKFFFFFLNGVWFWNLRKCQILTIRDDEPSCLVSLVTAWFMHTVLQYNDCLKLLLINFFYACSYCSTTRKKFESSTYYSNCSNTKENLWGFSYSI